MAAAEKFKEDTATAAEVAPMFAATQAFEKAILADRSLEHARLVAQRQQEAFNRKVCCVYAHVGSSTATSMAHVWTLI